MKTLKKIVPLVLVTILMVACLAACGSGLKGKKYVYKEIAIDYDTKGMSSEEKAAVKEQLELVEEMFESEFEDFAVKFKTDKLAVLTMGGEEAELEYKVKNNKIYFYDDNGDVNNKFVIKISGSKLSIEAEQAGVTFQIILKEK